MRAYVRTCPNIYFPSVLISLVVAVLAAVREYNNNMIMIIITREHARRILYMSIKRKHLALTAA